MIHYLRVRNATRMSSTETSREHKQRIDAVIDYITKNINGDVSLGALATIANYSPFYLQKLFRQTTGITPKQYIIKVRMESAALLLMIHPNKSIMEIAIDAGFSSPAVFSRAIKNYFSVAPEELRSRNPHEVMSTFGHRRRIAQHLSSDSSPVIEELNIRIRKVSSVSGIYMNSVFEVSQIQHTFKKINRLALAHDVHVKPESFYGIISPHQGSTYKALIALPDSSQLPAKFNLTEIPAGKYASYRITGNMEKTIQAAHLLFHKWLPENGYKIAGITGFEIFTGDPSLTAYEQLEREVFVPIEPL